MSDYIHDKVVKWFYDHEELLIAIMNKTPYQSDGWDYEIEVVNEFLTTEQRCYCGDIYTLGVIHRDDGPCHYPEHKEPKQEQEPVAWITQGGKGWLRWHKSYDDNKDSVPLYTTPPQRKPLTDEQIAHATAPVFMGGEPSLTGIARAIEAAHGIKE